MGDSYRLKNDGYPWRTIYKGRRAVGRVYRHAKGGWIGRIGSTEVPGRTETEAFEEVAAREMGYSSAAVLKQRNSVVRSRTRAVNRAWDAVAVSYLHSSVEGQMKILDRVQTAEQFTGFVGGVTRKIFR